MDRLRPAETGNDFNEDASVHGVHVARLKPGTARLLLMPGGKSDAYPSRKLELNFRRALSSITPSLLMRDRVCGNRCADSLSSPSLGQLGRGK